jgi:hypothetical protein
MNITFLRIEDDQTHHHIHPAARLVPNGMLKTSNTGIEKTIGKRKLNTYNLRQPSARSITSFYRDAKLTVRQPLAMKLQPRARQPSFPMTSLCSAFAGLVPSSEVEGRISVGSVEWGIRR